MSVYLWILDSTFSQSVYLSLCHFHTALIPVAFRVSLSISTLPLHPSPPNKSRLGLGNIVVLTIPTLPVYEHGISFHLFRTFNFFSTLFYSFYYTGLAFFIKYISKNFTLFDVM